MPGIRSSQGGCIAALLPILLFALGASVARADERARTPIGIWISVDEIRRLPTCGPAWENVLLAAQCPLLTPDLSDQNDSTNVIVMAKALVHVRTGIPGYRDEVVLACRLAIGTEARGRTLALGRELAAYVIAADLVVLPDSVDVPFRAWLRSCLSRPLEGRTLRSTHEDRPNNWGTHAGCSRAAIAVYLRDRAELERTARVFRGWLGDRSAYAGFEYQSLAWQADPARPVGVNPKGAARGGCCLDGVLADDQRRCGGFAWPPPRENYVYEALQGALGQAVILSRAGYDPWNWSDQALLRAFRWLHEQVGYPAEGDDGWQPHLVNRVYGTAFPAPVPARPGKNLGWTDWTHGSAR